MGDESAIAEPPELSAGYRLYYRETSFLLTFQRGEMTTARGRGEVKLRAGRRQPVTSEAGLMERAPSRCPRTRSMQAWLLAHSVASKTT